MQIINIPIEDIIPYQNNAKLHPKEQIEQIKKSILEFGNNDPIAIDENNVIIEGHGRLIALKELGFEDVECIRLSHLSDEQKRAYILVHNKLTMNTGFDLDVLQMELESITGIDMTEYSFELEVITEDEPEPEEDDANLDELIPEEAITKPGDLWLLGEHRLLCGDSTSPEDLGKLMNGEKADLVVTDPPYNVNVKNSQGMTIANDNMESSEFLRFLTAAFARLNDNLKEGRAFYVWLASSEWINFETALKNNGLKIRQELIWVKNQFILSRNDYHWRHEPCMYGWKDGAAHYFIDDRTQSTVIEDELPAFKQMKKEQLVELLDDIYSDKMSTTIIREDKPRINDLHPTMKPIKLIARLVKNSSKQGELVLDLFGGSGSTLITCEQLNRRANIMELDPKYCDAIIARWEKLTGRKAVLLNESC